MAGQNGQDANQGPSKEQIEAANAAELAKWEDDFPEESLKIPYKKDDDQTQASSGTDTDATDTDGDDNKDKEEQTPSYDAPAPVVTVEDPGEYTPADYSFEVTLKGGKTKTIKTVEDADSIAEDPENFETPKQLLDFIRRSQKMESQLDRDKEAWESKKETYEEQTKEAQAREQFISNTASEFDYLVSKKLLPPVDAKYKDADWSDPEVMKQPGVKEQVELLDYMVKENEARTKAKVAPLTSVIDAYNAWQLDAKRIAEEKEAREAGERRRVAGSRVAGVSPTQQGTGAPKGIAVGNPNVFKRSAAIWDN